MQCMLPHGPCTLAGSFITCLWIFVGWVDTVQVAMPLAGKVTFGQHTAFSCPVGSNFVDMFNGLYGPDGYKIYSPLCLVKFEGDLQEVLVSTLEFQCQVCGVGFYSLKGGSSTGGAREATNFDCLSCPDGSSCINGSVVALPGYWGTGNVLNGTSVLSMALCPEDYCCDQRSSQCDGTSTCAGHRKGPLCGDCADGYSVSLGSARCVESSKCSVEQGLVWLATLAAVFASAAVELVVVSGIWSSTISYPKAKMKLVVYFVQVRT